MRKMNRRPAPLVLIVDDHADTREMYAMYLAANGFRYVMAGDGATAIRVALGAQPPMAAMFAQQFITLVDDLAGYRIGDALHVAIARPVDAPLLLHPAASTVGERVAE